MKEMVGGCCVCSDERGWPDNPLVYCDGNGCTVAVHQACYGIVTVPTGPWYCRKCECPENKGKVRCELCPSKSGALKRSDTGGWAHVVCALYIPEVRFGDVTSMEPIVLRLIPQERYNKLCYICQDGHKSHRATAGACMQCNKTGCKQQFHVTCAQSLGLLCEEAGNYLDNVKYCGYCQHHYSKLKKGGNVKTIPPYKPVSHDSQSSDSSCEKEGEGSPMAGRCETPTPKSKGPGRKSSYSGSASGKNTPNTSKSTSANQQSNKKKPSPARRGSSASDASKASTSAQSPQDAQESVITTKASGRATPGGSKGASPHGKSEPVGVISSVAAATGAAAGTSGSLPPTVLQSPSKQYHETVITNTDSVETKQTKKRKAISASAAAAAAAIDYAPPPPPANDQTSQTSGGSWESPAPVDVPMDCVEKVIKKAKTDADNAANALYLANIQLPPPPPPAHSPRHLQSPLPGPSGMNPPSHIRSPSRPQVSAATEMPAPPPHIFHQPQKLAAMEPSVPGHAPHGAPGRGAWAGLNVAYEMQDHNKSVASNLSSKEMPMPIAPPPVVRNKKRAAMAASSAASAAAAAAAAAMASMPNPTTAAAQSLASVRRLQGAPPPPIYQETIKDSPPGSPGSDRPLKPKQDNKSGVLCTAPHMLGNELNPESGAAARLQEQLTAELAAHAVGGGAPDLLVPPPLINKAQPGSSRSGSSGAQSLDQLLERQWEQGSQFLMEQAQHFDIASLLSCLHQLRTENVRLEEHVGSLLQRRDHLLAVNARLAIPLNTVSASPPEPARCTRENGGQARAPPTPTPAPLAADRAHQLIMREVQQKPS